MTETASPEPPHPTRVDLADAHPGSAFRVVADTACLYFRPGTDRLIVSFDNLASIDTPWPRPPWLHAHIAATGFSLLGVQSHAKDWYRQRRTPALIRALRRQGFFDGFARVVFTGASMGGFAALNFAPLVPGATVLAFSPQSTMDRRIAPFERRFPWAVRNSDWTARRFLDAAVAVPRLPRAAILYDPFVPEDRAHAARLAAPHVQMLRLGHAGHEAVRIVIRSGAMSAMLRAFTETGTLDAGFWRAMRARRGLRKWRRALIAAAEARNHPRLTLRAAEAMLRDEPYLFATRARDRVLARHPDWGA
jgi:hypothetical protein